MSGERLHSLDALRGFSMLMIIGFDYLVIALAKAWPLPFMQILAEQFQHVPWHGFHFYDLVFPLFIFVSGATLALKPLSLAEQPWSLRKPYYRKLSLRVLLLVLLGIVYNHGWGKGLPASVDEVRYASVLARIGIAWGVAALIVWHCSLRQQVMIGVVILFGYPLLQWLGGLWLAEQHECTSGWLSASCSVNAFIDQQWLPGIRYRDAPVDPEGLLSQIPAVLNALAGYWTTRWLMQYQQSKQHSVLKALVIAIAAAVIIALLVNIVYPLNKTLWTSSFALLTSALSAALLLAFFLVIDCLKWRQWANPLYWIGYNALLIYLLTALFNWAYPVRSMFGQWIELLAEPWQPVISIALILFLQLWLLRWLFQKRLSIRL